MGATYNEVDPYAARWLRNLIAAGHIAPGGVDARSIAQLKAEDVGSGQFHAFAGIGVWSHAARLAGWPDDFPLWTGSCPCQPFSAAGGRAGFSDERHLWPEWLRLIQQRRPPIIAGEQVASRDGLAWLDTVRAGLEAEGYAVGAADLCAAGVGAPHIRQRLYFGAVRLDGLADTRDRLAHHHHHRRQEFTTTRLHDDGQSRDDADRCGVDGGGLVHADSGSARRNARAAACTQGKDASEGDKRWSVGVQSFDSSSSGGGLVYAFGERPFSGLLESTQQHERDSKQPADTDIEQPRQRKRPKTFWDAAEWVDCRDGKRRPTQPGLFPLVDGATARVGRLRAYGNAIVGPLAATFLGCLRDSVINS